MSKLEELVPPLELCKFIPKGEFEGSAFCYMNASNFTGERDEYFEIIEMKIYNGFAYKPEKYPAPTLQEVMENTPFIDVYINASKEYTVHRRYGSHCREYFRDKDGATAALKLWLTLEGIDYE